MRKHVFLSALAFLTMIPARAQLDLKGRVLEKANLEPVPNALVAVGGSSARTNAKGEFVLNGTIAIRPGTAASRQWPLLQGRYLRLPSRWADQAVRIEIFDSQGSRLGSRVAAHAGERVDLKAETAGWSGRFLRVSARGESFRFRLPPGGSRSGEAVDLSSAARETDGPAASQALAKSAATVRLDISADLLAAKSLNVRSDSGNLGDIVLDYPPRQVDTGAPPIYGAIRLFDGKGDSASVRAQMDSNWIMWVGPSRKARGLGATPVVWKILKDPQVPGRWTFSECCGVPAGGPEWGYDDLLTKMKFNDYQLHVEFNMMGVPGDEDPTGYCNSGVYQSNRYELQIETVPTPWDPKNSHGMASIINEFPPPSNLTRPNGKWQAYDITFRNDRWSGGKHTEQARTTIFWNGTLIHNNRKIAGSIACCDAGNAPVDSTLQGLKLQNEKGADVRFRNIWIKPLTIKDTLTNFGY